MNLNTRLGALERAASSDRTLVIFRPIVTPGGPGPYPASWSAMGPGNRTVELQCRPDETKDAFRARALSQLDAIHSGAVWRVYPAKETA